MGCTGTTLLKKFVRNNDISTKKIIKVILIQNADGSVNRGGPIIDHIKINLTINDHNVLAMALSVNTHTTKLLLNTSRLGADLSID